MSFTSCTPTKKYSQTKTYIKTKTTHIHWQKCNAVDYRIRNIPDEWTPNTVVWMKEHTHTQKRQKELLTFPPIWHDFADEQSVQVEPQWQIDVLAF